MLNNRYRILNLIGQGGFGRTFLAIDSAQSAQPLCIIKQLFLNQHHPFLQQKAIEQFHQEAQWLAELGSHPQIPQLLDTFAQDGHYFLVQEWIDGQNLEQELAETGAFTETEIRQLLTELLPVLQFIHDRQIIHRDIKPANIIRRRTTGQLVLVDFGAAKCLTQVRSHPAETLIGSAEYAAPEQLRGKADYTSDLYSLGVTCLRLLTQISPFDLIDSSENIWVWRKYLNQPISPALGILIDTFLRPAPKQRYQSAKVALRDLDIMPNSIRTASVASRSSGLSIPLSIPAGYAATVFDAATQEWRDISVEAEGWDYAPQAAKMLSPRLAGIAQFARRDRRDQTIALSAEQQLEWVWRAFTTLMIGATAAAAVVCLSLAIAPHPTTPAQTNSTKILPFLGQLKQE